MSGPLTPRSQVHVFALVFVTLTTYLSLQPASLGINIWIS